MEFDISRVYTAVNADELRIGDKVIVADTFKDLKENVNTFFGDCLTLTKIGAEAEERRFYESETHSIPSSWALAYLVEGVPKKKWRAYKNCDELVEDFKRRYIDASDHPVRLDTNPMWHPIIWVQHKYSGSKGIILNFSDSTAVVHNLGYNTDELFEDYTYLDGSPCGMEE